MTGPILNGNITPPANPFGGLAAVDQGPVNNSVLQQIMAFVNSGKTGGLQGQQADIPTPPPRPQDLGNPALTPGFPSGIPTPTPRPANLGQSTPNGLAGIPNGGQTNTHWAQLPGPALLLQGAAQGQQQAPAAPAPATQSNWPPATSPVGKFLAMLRLGQGAPTA